MTALQPDPLDDVPAVRIVRALRRFDWVDAEYLLTVVLSIGGSRTAWSKALSLLVKKGAVEVDRSQRTAVYRLARESAKAVSR